MKLKHSKFRSIPENDFKFSCFHKEQFDEQYLSQPTIPCGVPINNILAREVHL